MLRGYALPTAFAVVVVSSVRVAGAGADDDPFNDDGSARGAGGAGADHRPDRKRVAGEPAASGAAVYVEQDFFLTPVKPSLNEDRNYTMGVGFELSGRWVHDAYLDRPLRGMDWLLGIDQQHSAMAFGFGQTAEGVSPHLENHSFRFGVTAFTPDDLRATAVVRADRPYASLMFFSALRSTVDPSRKLALTSELTLGVLGLRVAERVQTWIHQQLRDRPQDDPADPLGWTHQISDGFEPTLKYTVGMRKTTSVSAVHDLTLLAEGSAGYYTNFAVGASLRLGLIGSHPWTFNSSPMTVGNQATADERPRLQSTAEAFTFAGYRARLVLFNALLQGQFAKSDHRLDTNEVERVVHEGEAGLSFGLAGYRLTWVAAAGRSPEHDAGLNRAHLWSSFFFSWTQPGR